MKKCPFCAEEIQEQAKVCKHCGRDLPTLSPDQLQQEQLKRTKAGNTTGQKIGIGCVAAIALWFGGCYLLLNIPGAKREADGTNARAITTTLCEIAMTERLTSPATADYPFGHVSSVKDLGGNRHELVSHVDSQNAFGATIRTKFRCVVEGSGDDVANYKVAELTVS